MPSVRLVIQAEVEGSPYGSPIILRSDVEQFEAFRYALDGAGDATTYSTIPALLTFGNVSVLFLRPDGPLNLRLAGQTNGGVAIDAGGVVFMAGVNITALSSASLVTTNNPADPGSAVTPTGFVGGSSA